MKPNDYIGFRDLELRQRLDAAIDASKGMLNLSAILRAAVMEKLEQIETRGLSSLLPSAGDEPHSARSEITRAAEREIVKKDAQKPSRAPGSPSRAHDK